MITEPGIYSISAEEYHADPCPIPSLSCSIIKTLCNESPLHAKTEHPRLNRNLIQKEKDIFDLGTLCHSLLLEGIDKADRLEYADWRTRDARDAKAASRQAGRIPILSHHWVRVEAMMAAARSQLAAHQDAKDAFVPGTGLAEQTIIWKESCGIWCRARLDWLTSSWMRIYDYKSTGTSANPESISRLMISSGWDIQAAFYLRGLAAIDPSSTPREFRFVVQETYPPYALTVIGIHPTFEWSGQKAVDMAIDKFAQSLASGQWPGYPNRVCYPELPAWKESQITAAELRGI